MDHRSSSNDKAHPFLVRIEPKQSSFSLKVPSHFCFSQHHTIGKVGDISNRKLFFSELRMVPDFYSQQAYKLNIDTEADLQQPMDQYIQFQFKWLRLLEKEQDQSTRASISIRANNYDAEHLATRFNAIALAKKVSNQKYPPAFLDWVRIYEEDDPDADDDPDLSKMIADIPHQAQELYGTPFNASVHGKSMLDPSIQSFPGVNNYAFPNVAGNDKGIRMRLFVQPGAQVVFSNYNVLTMLGFTVSQAVMTSQKQVVISNPKQTEWLVVIADRPPKDVLQAEDAKTPVRVSIVYRENNTTISTPKLELKMTKKEFMDDELFYRKMKDILNLEAIKLNIDVGFNFQNKHIVFPSETATDANGAASVTQLQKFNLIVSPALADRLGYGPVEMISATVPFQEVIQEPLDLKSRTLVYDTGIIYVTAKNSASNLLTDVSEQYLCSLEPKQEGVMKMVPYQFPQDVQYFHAPNFYSGSSDLDLSFNLFSIQTDGSHVPLDWITGANIIGNLRSRL